MTHSNCNFELGDGSVRALQQPRPVTPQALSLALRQVGLHGQATAYGPQGPALQAALSTLRRGGLSLSAPSARPANADPAALMVTVQPAQLGQPGAAVLFLAVEGPAPVAITLLLPAVQRLRSSHLRIPGGVALALALVQAPRAGHAMPTDPFSLTFVRVQ